MIGYWEAELLMSHEHFSALFLLSFYLRVSWFFLNKAFYFLILISTHCLLTCLFPVSFQLFFYKSQGGLCWFLLWWWFGLFFQISGILNASNSKSFHGDNKQLKLHRFRVEEESLNMNCREDRGFYWGYSEWEELDSSSGQMPLLEKAIELKVATLMNCHRRSLIGMEHENRMWVKAQKSGVH